MKKLIILFLTASLSVSIALGSEQSYLANGNASKEGQYWERLEMVELRDASGQVVALMSLPVTWQKIEIPPDVSGVSIKGPNNIKVTTVPATHFTYFSDPYMRNLAIHPPYS